MKFQSKNLQSDVRGIGVATNRALSGVSREFHNFLTDIEELVKTTTALTGEDLARAKAELNARIATAKESVEEMGGAIADRARDTAKVTDNYVHEQPWQAVGIGAALGLLIGLMLGRR
jgi:ElaB/YqjD/DUF883 family membrane-anchored ribosome-binding protein